MSDKMKTYLSDQDLAFCDDLPKIAGEETPGSSDTIARGDHVHPEQKTVEKFKNAREILVDLESDMSASFEAAVKNALRNSSEAFLYMSSVPSLKVISDEVPSSNLSVREVMTWVCSSL